MSSVNKIILVGNLGRDPEVKAFSNGDQVCNVSVATTDKWKDKTSGEMKEATEWHRVSFYGRLAEIAAQYLRKGSQVYVEGSIHTRKWQDKDGADKYSTEVKASVLQMLGGKPETERRAEPARTPSQPGKVAVTSSGFDDMDDDIPF